MGDVMSEYGLAPRGKPMPQTLEEWRHLAGLYGETMAKAGVENSKLRVKINKLEQKLEKVKRKQ